jgi:hypothetical protein
MIGFNGHFYSSIFRVEKNKLSKICKIGDMLLQNVG